MKYFGALVSVHVLSSNCVLVFRFFDNVFYLNFAPFQAVSI